MLNRPFHRNSVDEIEQVYRRLSTNRTTLISIRDELRLRDSRLAKALLKDVESKLSAGEPLIEELVNDVIADNQSIDSRSPQAQAAQIKIAELRQRLLDLSNRNRLINFKHTSKGGRQIRVVGEWLPKLHAVLAGEKPVEFVPLPPLPDEPEDERSDEFTSALEEALLTDKTYIRAVEKVDEETDDKAEFIIAKAERSLRDRLRKKLGWPTRTEVFSITAAEQAKKLGIDPSYELINPSPRRQKRRIQQWQTLVTEDELDRRLRALEHQSRESREEYGVETLYLVVGFIEWREKTPGGEAGEPNLSPLLLIPVGIEKRQRERLSRTVDHRLLIEDGEAPTNKHRDVYSIHAGADEVTVNLCLRERLRQDFGLELPEWDDELGVEWFLGQVQEAISDRPEWRVRSYATVSHLAFNRLAMWVDLDPEKPMVKPPHVHPVLGELFGGGAIADHDGDGVEGEDVEAGVPSLIMDCDSSQFAAIKAAMGGGNLTIQGPPGTGKSQTIANLIASLLHQGKSVLFVAEKMAALDVVHSRLSDAGIGDFLLELHSAKAAKKAVLESIKSRLMRRRRNEGDVSGVVTKRRRALRDKLNDYAAAINSTFGASGLTVHDIIWQSYEYRHKPVPDRLAGYRLAEVGTWDNDAIELRGQALALRVELEERYRGERTGDEHPWSWIENPNLHVEECDRLYRHVVDLLAKIEDLQTWIKEIQLVTLPSSYFALRTLATELAALGNRPDEISPGLWELAGRSGVVRIVDTVIAAYERRTQCANTITEIAPVLVGALQAGVQNLERLTALAPKVIPKVNATTDLERLSSSKTESLLLLTQLDSAMKLMAQLRTVLTWDANVAEAELLAAATFIELANKAPSSIVSKHHALGADRHTTIVRGTLDAMDACESRCAELNLKLKMPIQQIDLATLVRHRGELVKGGAFAIFRSSYREARNFCRSVLPDVLPKERLGFLGELCELLALRIQLGENELMRIAAGDLFTGWATSKQALRECCDWVEEVRQQTPFINPHSDLLRKVLFGLTQDQSALAKQLHVASWPHIFTSLSEQCRRQSIALNDVRDSLHRELDCIDKTVEEMRSLGWQGELSHEKLKTVASAMRGNEEASGTIALHPGILELLLPDPAAALTCVRAIAGAQLRVRSLPIHSIWRDRLVKPESVSDWIDFHVHVTGLDARLGVIEQVMSKLSSLAVLQAGNREKWERKTIADWAGVLRTAAMSEKTITTRAKLLASKAKVTQLGLEELVQGAHGSAMARFSNIGDLFRALYLKSMAFQAIEEHPCLAEFRHSSPATTRDKFSQLDHELKMLHRQELVQQLMERKPPAGVDTGLISARTELGLLSHVAFLDKPRTSVRDLLRRAGRALQTLKPCFMMSPLSVAQLIDRGRLNFDVVIFDEASQVRPEDAMSALARSRQFVVVGDQMQLPPTSFGEKTFNDEPLDDEDSGEVEESAAVESILQLASASYGNGRTLLWHYRSRDPSLIAFSNREFYRNELLLFPCPSAKSHATGVKYVWVGGHYSARTNVEEARTCAQAAVECMRKSPNRSLGIVALNRPQADLIQLELDRLIHEHMDVADYQTKWAASLEPLFVKNLENVQGDERDVIFVSTVFGDDESGRFYQRFGPINSSVGHRRLNVLFTRAKFQLVVFTSLPTEKIQLSKSSHWGLRALKEYLDYARTGRIERGVPTGGSEDSPFEVGVRAALENAGFQCEPQVGIAGFFVDLGIRHPRLPDHFIAGIECDGAAYHSTRSARDRDRLRQNVLESFGWKIYRVWSTDWFSDPHGQLDKLVAYLEKLKALPLDLPNHDHFDFPARFGKPRMYSAESSEAEGVDGKTSGPAG